MNAKSHPLNRCRRARIFPLVGLLAVGIVASGMAGCGSMMASMPLIGEPKNAPPRPQESGPFPGVFVETAQPAESKMTATERDKLASDLVTTRDTAATRTREEINRKPPPNAPASKSKKKATPAQKCENEPCR